ncbi:hypothetical protein SISNIDRAFT_460086 [Sistotremastrum niveocremeum HHB9708]|uniref:RRM domain-containing protein n=2 Tax=Sistotremastraceae TaxID=3402574 RepID=A0A164NZQ7_9AGAM|nr:hypothetical protein SISNIDRAFT_460086 [Sistotremastrum niveocremeum HHB9708]KZT36534.1 hypothetical protein SISSUDRAFT_1049772 [Sistotremastrum suecicum HHB10207 ss-3]
MDGQYQFDLDMMKRAMEQPGPFEMNKKPRYGLSNGTSLSMPRTASAATFENYGYGGSGPPQHPQPQPTPLYSTPNPQTIQPNSAPANNGAPPSPYIGMHNSLGMSNMAYNQMMGMNGMNGMNGMGAMANMNGMNGMNNMANMANMGGMGGMGNMGMGMNVFGGMGGFQYSPQMASFPPTATFPQSPLLQVSYSTPQAAAAAAAANNATGRTVYIGSLPPTASVDELLNLVHFGPIENVRVLPEKSCVFVSFLDGATAAAFHADATIKKLNLHGQELKVGWGKASPVPSQVMLAITQSNASRNVYLGGLDEGMTEEQLRDDLSRFGLIDQVKIVRDKNIGFVHFLSISVATKVVAQLPTEPAWAGKRINYGKDRCAYIPKSQQQQAAAAQAAAAQSLVAQQYPVTSSPYTATFGEVGNPTAPQNANLQVMAAAAVGTGMNRTVYIGNIHPETTTEDLCNGVRAGVLQSVRYMQDKHIAFVTFVDPTAAYTFFHVSSYQGLTLNNRRLKIGWGKNSGPLPPAVAMAVHSGATRNVYVGNIEDFDVFSEEKLRRDFGEYGEIELINFLKEKNCAFVNFTNIANAIKAIEAVKNHPDYTSLRISYGKDRCANPPRPGGTGRRNTTSTGGANGTGANGNALSPTDQVHALGLHENGHVGEDSDAVVLGPEEGEDVGVEQYRVVKEEDIVEEEVISA